MPAQVPEIDVNTIPAAFISRVDIVTGGRFGAYGSDAVTGVINFVLKKELEGFQLDARQNLTEQGDASLRVRDLTFGTGFRRQAAAICSRRSAGSDRSRPFREAATSPVSQPRDGCTIPGTRDELGIGQATAQPDLHRG